MNGIYAFFSGIGITSAVVAGALVYLHQNLRTILTELCGSAERARFWAAFSNITLFLTPLIFALHFQPQNGASAALIYEASSQIASALLGLVAAIVVLGFIIGRFIAWEHRPFAPTTRTGGAQGSQAR
ncbi:MAG TPA: hypothetical protein VKS20_06060 [Candidatus Acidoferrales bacterium]|nr:hypothetical protein [Candidatus Acidoferrales bacterium]